MISLKYVPKKNRLSGELIITQSTHYNNDI